MTAMNGLNDPAQEREKYLTAWAEMMVTMWLDRMTLYGVGDSIDRHGNVRKSTGDLRSSVKQMKDDLSSMITKESGGNITKISHLFKYYGIFLDGGVFPGVGGIGQNYISNPNRVSKPWLWKPYTASKIKLKEKMLELTGQDFLLSMRNILLDANLNTPLKNKSLKRQQKNFAKSYAVAKGRR
jgi:hypothetical protein